MNAKAKEVPEAPEDFAEKNRIAQTLPQPAHSIATRVDVTKLPDEVKANLVGFDSLELEQFILTILANPPVTYIVDKIVMTLWLNYQKQYDRMKVIARLRALVEQGLVKKHPMTRGTYSLTEAGVAAMCPPVPANGG